jgi:hypothetical protein
MLKRTVAVMRMNIAPIPVECSIIPDAIAGPMALQKSGQGGTTGGPAVVPNQF